MRVRATIPQIPCTVLGLWGCSKYTNFSANAPLLEWPERTLQPDVADWHLLISSTDPELYRMIKSPQSECSCVGYIVPGQKETKSTDQRDETKIQKVYKHRKRRK